MQLTECSVAITALRGVPAQQVRAAVTELLPDLRHLAADNRVDPATRIGLLTRAARILSPAAPRADTPAAALATLEDLAARDPGRGRPAIGPATTVRLTLAAYEALDEIARREGLVDGDGEPRRGAAIRMLVDEALTHRGI